MRLAPSDGSSSTPLKAARDGSAAQRPPRSGLVGRRPMFSLSLFLLFSFFVSVLLFQNLNKNQI
jgi:hypothetical protein